MALQAALLCLAPLVLGQGVEVPRNDGWVTDLAGMLTPDEERALEALMESYRQGTTHEIALLTVPDLGGQPIESFALKVAETWKMGTAEESNAALLVVSKADRKIRIEVGRGLEGDLTDATCGRIIRNVITPRFRDGRFHEGLREGVEAIHAAIGGDYAAIRRASEGGNPASALGSLFSLFLLLVVFSLILGRRGRGRRGGLGPALPWILLGAAGAGRHRRSGGFGGGFGGGLGGGGGFGGFGGGGSFGGGGASGGW